MIDATWHPIAPGIDVLERGWLSANQTVLWDEHEAVIVDSGYHLHAEQLTAVLDSHPAASIGYRKLINTHCHSDHMGGNAALIERYDLQCIVPVGELRHIEPWDPQGLWLARTGQYAPLFKPHATIAPNEFITLAGQRWQAIAAPGHDDDALMLLCEARGILITGDALWQSGTGFVWPVTDGKGAPQRALETVTVIERLAPRIVIPGHGAPFAGDDVRKAIAAARSKLELFARDPVKCATNVLRSFAVFDALALHAAGDLTRSACLERWKMLPVFQELRTTYAAHQSMEEFARQLFDDIVSRGALRDEGGRLVPSMRV
jgi:glyoxylase-like metal-dependent hydrolase (beta-lactamase superfamily II)